MTGAHFGCHSASDNPDANIGLACGSASGLCVIDVDVKNGAPGLANWLVTMWICTPPVAAVRL
jgi:Bifunctional DNA primase/polymerase, N-terminal